MRRLLSVSAVLASASLALAACATVQPQRHEGPMGSLVGVVKLPEGASAEAVCPSLQVAAVTAEGVKLGESSVHVGRGRCTYTVDDVQANVPVTLSIQANAPQACATGSLAPQSQPESVQLRDTETRTIDVALHCA